MNECMDRTAYLLNRKKNLILVRGLPGSGKSTFAKEMTRITNDQFMFANPAVWLETDMFFGEGENYKFDPNLLAAAHAWCQNEVQTALNSDEINTICVSNTFSQKWEMQPYLDMAKEFGARVTIIKMEGNYGSIHAPTHVREKMKSRWEDI